MPLFKRNIEQMLLAMKLKAGKPITELQFFAAELTEWESSPLRREMLDGDRYYNGDHDILGRKRMAIGNDGKMEEIKYLPNNRIVDNQYAKHVDQKKNYLLGKPLTFESGNAEYVDAVKKVLNRRFMRMLKNSAVDMYNSSIIWLYPYYNDNGELVFKYFPGYEILPFWKDAAHTEIECALRLYEVEEYVSHEKRITKKVNVFKEDGVYNYVFENGVLVPDPDADKPKSSYVTVEKTKGQPQEFNWERIPLIPIKYNSREIPLIRRARGLQDAINQLRSDFVNNMEEDIHSTIIVLKNYDGQDLGEFRHNLATYGAVKVRAVEGVQGGVDKLEIEVNSENYKVVLEMLKSALIENMRSFDGKDERLKGTPNQMNIQSLYMDIDLDANDTESELHAAFEEIFWFVNQHLANTGAGDFEGVDIKVIFNRDTLVNESEVIENCGKSAGVISDETIIAQHPWVDDPQKELEKMKAQKEKEAAEAAATDPYKTAFVAGKQTGGPEDVEE